MATTAAVIDMRGDAAGGQMAAGVANGAGQRRTMKGRGLLTWGGGGGGWAGGEGGGRRRREMVRHSQRQTHAHMPHRELLNKTSKPLSQP